MFRVLGEKINSNINSSLSSCYYFSLKIYQKKSSKGLQISISRLIFAPRLRDNAYKKRKEVWVSG